jgi:hypothetical protein
MKLAFLVLGSLLALSLAVPAASAIPPVCLEKEAGALGVTVEARVTCGPQATLTRCPPVGDGPCWTVTVDPLGP